MFDDMDYFLPSDVARLVLGFLKENGYSKTYKCFLKECADLKEYVRLLQAGRELQTTILGYNLLLILQEWGRMRQGQTPAHAMAEKTKSKTTRSNLHRSASSACKNKKSPRQQPIFMSSASNNQSDSNESDSGAAVNVTGVPETPIVWSSGSVTQTNLSERFNLPETAVVEESSEYTTTVNPHSSPSKRCKLSDMQGITLLSKTDCDEADSKSGYPTLKGLLNIKPSTLPSAVDSTSSQLAVTSSSVENVVVVQDSHTMETDIVGSCLQVTQSSDIHGVPNDGALESVKGEARQVVVTDSSLIPAEVREQLSTQGSVRLECLDTNNKCLTWINTSVHGQDGASTSQQTVLQHNDADGAKRSPSKAVKSPSSALYALNQVTPRKGPVPSTFMGPDTTPVKLLQATDGPTETRSPRRKKPKTPRKRTSDISPVSVHSKTEDPMPMFQKILNDTRLHEKLAETCNKVTSIVQLKLNRSGKEGEGEVKPRVSLDHEPAEELETVTASKSLEEILDMDTNFATDLVGDKIDMNDPAFDSLFRLFGTDKESFNENLKKEKNKTEQMESEVEELEKSIQEMAGSYADSPLHDEFYGSPHPVVTTTESTETAGLHDLADQLTDGTISLLQDCNMETSPVHSTPSQPFKGPGGSRMPDQCLYSPCSTATQPFSPCASEYHNALHTSIHSAATTVSPTRTTQTEPPTLNTSQHLDSPGRLQEVPGTPRQFNDDIEGAGSPVSHLSSTPLGSPTAENLHHSVNFSTPTRRHPNSCLPPNCSPLVKADIHMGSPIMVQKSGPLVPKAKRMLVSHKGKGTITQMSSPALVPGGSSQAHVSEGGSSDTHCNQGQTDSGVSSQVSDSCSVASGNMSFEHNRCSTIENTVGFISLPQPQEADGKGRKRADGNHNDKPGKGHSNKGKDAVRGKKLKSKRDGGKKFTTLKGILAQPSSATAGSKHEAPGPSTPEKYLQTDMHTENIVLMSPGGSTISVPMLGCHDDDQTELNESANIWGENLDTSTQLSILPENQVTQSLLQSITEGGSNTGEVLSQIQALTKQETKKPEKVVSGKATRKKKSGHRKESKKQLKDAQGYFGGVSEDSFSKEPFTFDPNEMYTATPVTSANKNIANVSRSLNFGKDTDKGSARNLQKIVPKPPEGNNGKGGTLIILNNGAQVLPNAQPRMVLPQMVMPSAANVMLAPRVVFGANGGIQVIRPCTGGNQAIVSSQCTGNQAILSSQFTKSQSSLPSMCTGNQASVPSKLSGNQAIVSQPSSNLILSNSVLSTVSMSGPITTIGSQEVSDNKSDSSLMNAVVSNELASPMQITNRESNKSEGSKLAGTFQSNGSSLSREGTNYDKEDKMEITVVVEETIIGSMHDNSGDSGDKRTTSSGDKSDATVHTYLQEKEQTSADEGLNSSVMEIVGENNDDLTIVKADDTSSKIKSQGDAPVGKKVSRNVTIPKLQRNPMRDPRLAHKHALIEQKMKSIVISAEKLKQMTTSPAQSKIVDESQAETKDKVQSPGKGKCDKKDGTVSKAPADVKSKNSKKHISLSEKEESVLKSDSHAPKTSGKNDTKRSKSKEHSECKKEAYVKMEDISKMCKTYKKSESSEKQKKKNSNSLKQEKLKVKITSKKIMSPVKSRSRLKVPYKKVNQQPVCESDEDDDVPLKTLQDKMRLSFSPLYSEDCQTVEQEGKLQEIESDEDTNMDGQISNDGAEQGIARSRRRVQRLEEETSDEEEVLSDDEQFTSGKMANQPVETDSSAKEVLLERVGLTPTKAVQSILDFKSPERTNPLDVLAQWQHSGSRRKATPGSVGKSRHFGTPVKSPFTPRKTPAKKLFETPEKNRVKKIRNEAEAQLRDSDTGIDTVREAGGEFLESAKTSDGLEALESEVLQAVDSILAVHDHLEANEETDLPNISDNSFMEMNGNLNQESNAFWSQIPGEIKVEESETIKIENNGNSSAHGDVNVFSIPVNSEQSKKKDKKKKRKKDKKDKKDKKHKHRKRSHGDRSDRINHSLSHNDNNNESSACNDSPGRDVQNDSFEENKPYHENADLSQTVHQPTVEDVLVKTVMSQITAGIDHLTESGIVDMTNGTPGEHQSSQKHKKGKKRRREDESLDREARRERKRRRKEEKRNRLSQEKLSSINIGQALNQLAEKSSPPGLSS